jgi:hypothetical protein
MELYKEETQEINHVVEVVAEVGAEISKFSLHVDT